MDSDGAIFNTSNYQGDTTNGWADLLFRDGSVRHFSRNAPGNFQSMTGPNGNYLLKEARPSLNDPPTPPVDTLGRTLPLWGSWPEPSSSNPPPAYAYPSELTITDYNGVAQTYTLHFTALTNLPESAGPLQRRAPSRTCAVLSTRSRCPTASSGRLNT
jgi:hypothetical protein